MPATVDWTELGNALDVNLNLSTGEADITTRANNGWKATAATLKEGSIEFEMLWKPTDAGFTRQKAVAFTWRPAGVLVADPPSDMCVGSSSSA